MNSSKAKKCRACDKILGKNYYVQYSFEGKRKIEKVGDSIGFAREVLAKRQNDIREGKFFGNVKAIHWGQFFDTHYKSYCEKNLTELKSCRFDSARNFKLFQKSMDKITRADIEEYRKFVDNGKRANSTINRYMHVVRFAFNYAEELELINKNPARKLKMQKEEPKERRVISNEEEEKLLLACKISKTKFLYHFVMIALYTGMRYSEVLDIKWTNVSLQQRSIKLYKTKNNETREIPIIDKLVPVIEELKEITGDFEYAFTNTESGEKIGYIKRSFKTAVDRAEIGNLCIHELRHTMITRLAASGASIPEIQQISGHKTAKMVQRYTHVGLNESLRTIDRLSRFLDG